ncbi:MAG: bifunctional photosynthetic reaction center subunit L/M [Chloroflexota bacterium]
MSSNNINIITGRVVADDYDHRGARPAAERAMEMEPLSIAEVEAHFKKKGGTLLHYLFGADPFDFWLGRFYVGLFGVISAIGIFFGVLFYFYQVIIVEGTFNLIAARLDPPPISAGLSFVGFGEPGFAWQVIVFFSTIAFVGWALRQAEISNKLGMSFEVPISFGAVVFSWITIQILRPIAMGAWGNGFSLGITHHLDWVSNIGYQYFNFFYNPFHAIGISLLFTSTLVLAMHGAVIWSGADRPMVREETEDGFWRNLLGYSIGEIGIHRLAFWLGTASVLFANICIFLSGTLVHDWNEFWLFWEGFPLWQVTAATTAGAVGSVIWRGRRGSNIADVDPEELEYGGYGLESTTLRRPIHIKFMERLFDLGQVGPVYLGAWGLLSVGAAIVVVLISLDSWLYQVDYSPIAFWREFFVLGLYPPSVDAGLGFSGSWHGPKDIPYIGGDNWIVATAFLHVSVLAWAGRIYSRAKKAGLGPQLFYAYLGALALYFSIYLFRPMLMGTWAQAPGHGFKAVLDWTNHVSVQTGNFYYNPFHMISIFFLLGSTLLLAMHGASIVATSKWGSYREAEEMFGEGSGTQRAQLFWRWVMGWQASSKTIHMWAWWFATLCGITGAIGILISGTLIHNWFLWAQQIGIVAPLP